MKSTRGAIGMAIALASLVLGACGGGGSGGGSPPTYHVGGTVSGLRVGGLVLNDGTRSIAVDTGATSFAFDAGKASGASYAVTVGTQPAGQTCRVVAGTGAGVVSGADVATVQVTCRNYVAYVVDFDTGRLLGFPVADDGSVAATPSSVIEDTPTRAWAFAPDGAHVYVVGHHMLKAFSIDAEGKLAPVPGTFPEIGFSQAIAISPDGRYAYVADADEESIREFAIRPDATLAPLTPSSVPGFGNAEGIAMAPDGKSAYVVGNGGTMAQFAVGDSGQLTPLLPPSVMFQSGIHTMAIAPDGGALYVSSGIGSAFGTVDQFRILADGTLQPFAGPTIDTGIDLESIVISPDGRHLYAAESEGRPGTAGHIETFAIGDDGTLSHPDARYVRLVNLMPQLTLSPDGAMLYCMLDYQISAYSRAVDGSLAEASVTDHTDVMMGQKIEIR